MHGRKNSDMDVIILGSGGAALPAAIEAYSAWAQAAMVEKKESLGGTSIVSGGGCWMGGYATMQESLGIHDSPDEAFEDWIKWGQGAADEQWARFYIEHSLHDLYFWAKSLGARWVDIKFQQGNRVHRWHRPFNNRLGLTTLLMDAAQARGLAGIYTSSEGMDIVLKLQGLWGKGSQCRERASGG